MFTLSEIGHYLVRRRAWQILPMVAADPRQTLDFWASTSSSSSPSPVLIFFHGGGFVRGNKYFCRQMREVRQRGAAVIAVNYRLVWKPGRTVAEPMEDSLLIFEFVKQKAEQWNIDPDRIALHGKSSGGCLALWLGMKKNICGVTTHNAPTSLEPELLVEIGKRRLEAFWPIWAPMSDSYTSVSLLTKRVRNLIDQYSPLKHVHHSSPPLYLQYTADQPPDRIGWLKTLHCVRYGELMKEQYDGLELSCEISSPSSPPKRTALEFLCEVMKLPQEAE